MSKCTPEYNQETRRMMERRDELARIAKGAESGDFGNAIRHKANEHIDSGLSAQDVLDKTHAFINQYAKHSKEEVAQAIVGQKRAAPTRTEAFNQRKAIKTELRDLMKLKDKDAAANKTRQTVLRKQLAELDRRQRENDYSKPESRAKRAYPEDIRKLELQRDIAKRQIDEQIEGVESRKRPLFKRALEVLNATHLFNIFTSPFVYPKLAAAVVGGHVLAVGQGASISMAKILPSIRRIADVSARQGAGLTLAGLKARAGGLLGAPRAAAETWFHGRSRLEAAYGDTSRMSDAYLGHMGTLTEALSHEGAMNKLIEGSNVALSYVGRSHGVMKVFLSHPEFFHSLADQVTQLQKQLKSQGKTPEEIAEFLSRDSTRATMNVRAMNDAMESKMQGKNKWNEKYTNFIGELDRSKNGFANTLGFVLKQFTPVMRVGPNVFKQGTSLMAGGVKAALEARTEGEMTPERADYIMKNIGQQGVGLMLVGIGMAMSKYLGGVQRPGDKKREQEQGSGVKPGEAMAGGMPVGGYAFHGAPAAMLQMGAGLVHVYEEERHLNHEDAVNAALLSIGSNTWNWTERTLPYTDQARRMANTAMYGRGAGEIVGDTLRSMFIPQIVQQEAAREDTYKDFRKPKNIGQDIETGIPKSFGLPWKRQNVPEKR